MSHWLDPVAECLEEDTDRTTLEIFIRDDDGGWDDARLLNLIAVTDALDLPLDVALIPDALSDSLAAELLSRKALHRQHLGLHQHGYRHANHEPEGRKCEFGKSRSANQQREDISAGKKILTRLLGSANEPIFTPPWNRCSQQTINALQDCGFLAISRDVTAEQLPLGELRELPVAVDWQKQRSGRDALARDVADTLRSGTTGQSASPVGIMLHHAVMTDTDIDNFEQMVSVMRRSGRVRFISMYAYLTRHFRIRPDKIAVQAPRTAV